MTSDHARRTGAGIDQAAAEVGLRAATEARRARRRRRVRGCGLAARGDRRHRRRRAAGRVPRGGRPVRTPKVVIVGAGMAGLGCALRLWSRYGIRADVVEYDDRPGGRIRTLRGHFADSQLVEEHAEFINPEHTATLRLAHRFGLKLDNTDHYPEPRQDQLTLRFGGRRGRRRRSTATGIVSGGSSSMTRRSARRRGRRSTRTARSGAASGIGCRSRSGSTPTYPAASTATSASSAYQRCSMSTAVRPRSSPR